MTAPLTDDRSTPRYAALFVFGVIIGSVVRLAAWALPSGLVSRLTERLLN